MRLKSLIVALLLLATPLGAQERNAWLDGDLLIPSCKFPGALCGYLDRAGRTVIEPQFDWAGRFVEGRARVLVDGFYGFIDTTGDFALEPIFDEATDFWNGYVQARRRGMTFLIDASGAVTSQPGHDLIVPLDNRHVLLGQTKPGARKPLLSFRTFVSFSPVDWAIFDRRTGTIEPLGQAYIRFLTADIGSKFWWVENQNFFLTDTDGTRLSDAYGFGGRLSFDRAIVSRGEKSGAIDGTGQVVIPLVFDYLWPFSIASHTDFLNGEIKGLIDRDGHPIHGEAPSARPRALPLRIEYHRHGRNDYLRRDGRTFGAIYRNSRMGCHDGLSHSFEDGRVVVHGKEDARLHADSFQAVLFTCGAPARVWKTMHESGFLSQDGKLLSGRYFEREIYGFHNGLAVLHSRRNQIAIIDPTGGYLLPPVHSDMAFFEKLDGPVYMSTPEGAIPVNEDLARALRRDPFRLRVGSALTRVCSDDMVWIVEEAGQFSYRDIEGRDFIGRSFDFASCFRSTGAWVALTEEQRWCKINKRGEIIQKSKCTEEQPLIIFEEPGRTLPPEAATAYQKGLHRILEAQRSLGQMVRRH